MRCLNCRHSKESHMWAKIADGKRVVFVERCVAPCECPMWEVPNE